MTIHFDAENDDEYNKLANLLWHVMYASSDGDFSVTPDSHASADELNRHWTDLGEGRDGW